jgi:hypothetical protein
MSQKKKVKTSYKGQSKYEYELEAGSGRSFDPDFKPDLTPKEMLELGVFGGHYFLDEKATKEFPKSWFASAKLSDSGSKEKQYNYFNIQASQPLEVWQKKGWIHDMDPYGWFQWYCRYYLGRRLPEEDKRQIKRWKAIQRHSAQVQKNCRKGDESCRPKQRQALLHWAYDSRKL